LARGTIHFPPTAEHEPAVEKELRSRIRERGAVTFAEFMEVALYLPGRGYYMREDAAGRRADFLTSPQAHPAFGAMLGRQARAMWVMLERPKVFTILEYGAGCGSLAVSLLESARAAAPDFYAALRYEIVESSPAAVAAERAALARHEGKVSWAPAGGQEGQIEKRRVVGCILSNEIADALPFHRVVVREGELREIHVSHDGERFVEQEGPLSTPSIERHLAALGVKIQQGAELHVSLAAAEWMGELARTLERGWVVTIDYGERAEELYSRGRAVLCCRRHTAVSDPLLNVGIQDITAGVDFTWLERAGRQNGLEWASLCTQAELLLRLGARQYLDHIACSPLPPEEKRRERKALLRLLDEKGLGCCKVLAMGRGVEPGLPAPADEAWHLDFAGASPGTWQEIAESWEAFTRPARGSAQGERR
jgi:SAM-dependent MidA family methyltransferase